MIPIRITEDFEQRGLNIALGCLHCSIPGGNATPDMARTLEEETITAARRIAETPIPQWEPVRGTRKAYKALGKDPARYRPSAEALLRRIMQGKELSRVNAVVDVNNLVSIRTGFSIGAYDLAKVQGTIVFRRAEAGESYAGIGRGALNLEGLPVLADDLGPFGCPTSDSERTMITPDTRDLLMVLFGFNRQPSLREAIGYTAGALEMYSGADRVEVYLLPAKT